MKQIATTILLFIGLSCFAQQQNVFLERGFWKGNPDLATVKQKITEGNDAPVFNGNGFDAVTNAILEKADDGVITYLLTLDGNGVDKRTHDSRIYLHWAAYAGKTEIMKMLLDKGSSVSARGSHGNTPLTFAAGAGQMDTKVYDLLIAQGVDISQEKNQDGANALLLIAPYLKDVKELDYFTSKGIALNSTDTQGNGIFNYAAKGGTIDFLKSLVNKETDYKTLNQDGGNAFLLAAQGTRGHNNTLAVYEYLKSLGLKANIVTKEGYTPLHRLAYNTTDPAIFEFFLAEGADVNQKDAEGNTPFLNAASRNELEVVQLLSKKVNDLTSNNNDGQTALMLAVRRNSPEVVDYLLETGDGANDLQDVKDKKGNYLSYYLVESFDAEKPENFNKKLKLLQEKGVDINSVQSEGNTLYHLAAKANDLELLKRLSEFDIPVNAKNEEGLTALHLAAMKAENDEMMKYLISKGADTTIKTDFEESAHDLASENELLQKQNVPLQFLN